MMKEGYAWIVTYGLTDHLSFMDNSTFDVMHGILTVKPYVVDSNQHEDLNSRFKEWFLKQNPNAAELVELVEPSVFALWAYDMAWALALTAESFGKITTWKKTQCYRHPHNRSRAARITTKGSKATRRDSRYKLQRFDRTV